MSVAEPVRLVGDHLPRRLVHLEVLGGFLALLLQQRLQRRVPLGWEKNVQKSCLSDFVIIIGCCDSFASS